MLQQCDALDGLEDGVIGRSDTCGFEASALVCAAGATEGCWRLYFLKADAVLIVMLGGGNKSSQRQDIGRAMQLANQIELSEVRHEQEDQRR